MAYQDRAIIEEMLKKSRVIAVVGISDKPERSSYGVAQYLSRFYDIIPVNPNISSWLGLRCYRSLMNIPAEVKIDLVDVFRRSEDVMSVVEDAIARAEKLTDAQLPPYLWLQQGVVNLEAARKAEAANIKVVMDSCIAVEHRTWKNWKNRNGEGDD